MARLQVGDWVRYRVGRTKFLAEVVEDLGPLGVRGDQLVLIETTQAESGERRRFSMPARELDELAKVSAGALDAPPRLTLLVDDEEPRVARLVAEQSNGATEVYERDQWGHWTRVSLDAFGEQRSARSTNDADVSRMASSQPGVHRALEERGLLSRVGS